MAKVLDNYRVLVISLVLVIAVCTVFYPLRSHPFISFDDMTYIVNNQHVRNGLTWSGLKWAFSASYADNWHPLTWLSHMLDCQLFSLHAGFHHLTNLLLHTANTLLLFMVLKRMTGAVWRSAFVAAAFALHPLHVESVAWIAERKDVLSTFFWMLTMAAYLEYVRRPGLGWYRVTLVVFALGLMSKPMLVTLPFVLLLLDYWPLDRFQTIQSGETAGGQAHENLSVGSGWRLFCRLVWEKMAFFVFAGISSVLTFLAQFRGGAVTKLEDIPIASRVSNALVSYVRYTGKMVWPRKLAIFYPHPVEGLPIWQTVVAAIILVAITILVVRLARSCKYLPVGWFWYLGTLVPVIGLVQVGKHAIADRYTYVPLIGLFVITAWGVPALSAKCRYRKIVLGVLSAAVLMGLSVCTRLQLRHWRNSIALFQHAATVTEDNFLAHFNLAQALAQADGRGHEAIIHLNEARRIIPENVQTIDTLASLMATRKGTEYYNPDEAIRLAEQGCKLSNYKNPRLLGTLASAYASKGRLSEAIALAEKSLQLAESSKQQQLAETIRKRLLRYRGLRLQKGGPHFIEPLLDPPVVE